jgi:rubrerythrin
MARIVKWKEEDGEDVLWTCISCGAELHSDCVGATCPVCGVQADDIWARPDDGSEDRSDGLD